MKYNKNIKIRLIRAWFSVMSFNLSGYDERECNFGKYPKDLKSYEKKMVKMTVNDLKLLLREVIIGSMDIVDEDNWKLKYSELDDFYSHDYDKWMAVCDNHGDNFSVSFDSEDALVVHKDILELGVLDKKYLNRVYHLWKHGVKRLEGISYYC